MHSRPVDRGGELVKPVQPRFVRPPVVLVAPVRRQLAHVIQRDAVVPAHPGQLVGPPGPGQPVPQVVQVRLGDVDTERQDLSGHGPILSERAGLVAPVTHRAIPSRRKPSPRLNCSSGGGPAGCASQLVNRGRRPVAAASSWTAFIALLSVASSSRPCSWLIRASSVSCSALPRMYLSIIAA